MMFGAAFLSRVLRGHAGGRAKRVGIAALFLVVLTGLAIAGSQMGPRTNYSAAQIQAAVEAAPGYNSSLMGDAGGLGTFESSGNTGINNGSCCTGVFQINTSNLASYGYTPQEYADLSLQQQADVWVNLTNKSASSGPVEQLQQMGTFDGRPVDSNLELACIQLGTGNCQKMINSGSCSGFADRNGTTICDMANNIAAKSGQPSSAEQTAAQQAQQQAKTNPQQTQASSALSKFDSTLNNQTNLNGVNITPESPGPNGSMMSIGDPTVCWVCDAALYSMGAIETAVGQGSPAIVQMVWPVFVVLVGIALLLRIGTAVVEGKSPWPVLLGWLPKVAIIFGLFLGGTIAPFGTSGSSTGTTSDPGISLPLQDTGIAGSSGTGAAPQTAASGSLLFDYFLSPPLELGAAVGTDIASFAQSKLGAQLPNSTCTHDDLSTAKVVQLASAANALLTLVCEVHEAVSVAILVGGIVATHPEASATITDQATGLVLFFCGLAMMLLAFMSLVGFAFALIEAILKVGMVAVFLPLILFMWLFETTKRSVQILFSSALFSFFLLACTGAASILMIFIILLAISYGLGQDSTNLSVQSVMSQFDTLAAGMGMTSPQGFGKLARFICFSCAGSLLAGRVMKSAQDLAMEISQFRLGMRGDIAKVGTTMVSRGASIAVGAVSVGAVALGRIAGGMVGRGVGRVGRMTR